MFKTLFLSSELSFEGFPVLLLNVLERKEKEADKDENHMDDRSIVLHA